MKQYYTNNLSAERLRRCYDIAPVRVKQYLKAEIDHVLSFISPTHRVLELGCGYGRVLDRLLDVAASVVGIDVSYESLCYARHTINQSDLHLMMMDAGRLAFSSAQFDVIVCIQNGISAFKVDTRELVRESMRVTKKGGVCLFSTYTESFWNNRLEWFRLQSEEGLIGEIDWSRTKEGVIICRDGFKATTFSKSSLLKLTESLGLNADIKEIDGSSLFWEIEVT